jgi:hypothetical protein
VIKLASKREAGRREPFMSGSIRAVVKEVVGTARLSSAFLVPLHKNDFSQMLARGSVHRPERS